MAQMVEFIKASTLDDLKNQVNEWFKFRTGLNVKKINWRQDQRGDYIVMIHFIQTEPEVC